MAPSALVAMISLVIILLQLQWHVKPTFAFQAPSSSASVGSHHQLLGRRSHQSNDGIIALHSSNDENNANNAAAATKATNEAEQLLAKAKAIRESLELEATNAAKDGSTTSSKAELLGSSGQEGKIVSDFSLQQSQQSLENTNCYRLYLDIGREPGTWMDPRWGASGRRIECTLDVSFSTKPTAGNENEFLDDVVSDEITSGLIKTVTSKSSSLSQVYKLQYAPYARLRRGFDKMAINDGGFCIETSPSASLSSSSTLRFCIDVGGTTDGDVSIPPGYLYFALPYFGTTTSTSAAGEGGDSTTVANKMNLSNKEGTITVKQMGWHTGWYREESRILGVFRAVPLDKARERDKF